MPIRPEFWGIPHEWNPALWAYSIMFLAALVLLVRFVLHARVWWQVGRPEMRWDHLPTRVWRLIQYAIVQTKVLGQRYPGVMHVAIAWAFFVFFVGTTLAAVNSHLFEVLQLLGNADALKNPETFVFLKGEIYLAFKLILDLYSVLFLVGAALAGYRRFIQKPRGLTLDNRFTFTFVMLVVIVAGGLITESLRLAAEKPGWAVWSPVGWLIAQLWLATGASKETLTTWHLGLWALHLLTVVITLATLPVGTLLHVLTSPLNTFFSKLDRPMGQLKPVAQTKEGQPIYVSTLRGLTWKQLLDGDACTECGRCQDACPAFAAGTPLSPKQVILGIRDALRRDGAVLLRGNGQTPLLVGEAIKDAVLWSCTTCGACVRECPVLIEHLDAIVDMRRYLVSEGRMDAQLQEALAKLGRYGNSFGKSERLRAQWAQTLQPKLKDARKEPVEYLWFVGDYASYSPTVTKITRQTAQAFQKAGLDFGILYEGERNAGNDARRVGEEGLFEVLVEKNVGAMSKANFKTIVTTDPHSYNTLKHEYPRMANSELRITDSNVLHYAELLDRLITSGRLKFNKKLDYIVTYHDPCYLGRYNGVYDAPRRVIEATGCKLVEMPRHGERAFCCGAGGGRIWMEEGAVKERPSEARIREAVALDGVSVFVAVCPKDITMFRDAVKTTGSESKIVVKDLIELVHEAM